MSDLVRMRYQTTYTREDYPDDVTTLQRWLNAAGYDVSRQDVTSAWEEHSGKRCASWLIITHAPREEVIGYLLESLVPA